MREQLWARMRGEVELKLNVKTLLSVVLSPVIALVVIIVFSSLSAVDSRQAASVLVFVTLVLGCFGGMNTEMVADQLDGTILRCRTLGTGVWPYLLAKASVISGYNLVAVAFVYVVCALAFPGQIMPHTVAGALALAFGLLTAVTVSITLGAFFGAINKSNAGMLGSTLVSYAVMATSGVLFPISAIPTVIGWVIKALPVYWVGNLFRMAGGIVPADISAVLLSISIPAVWLVVGCSVLPRTIAAMTNRQTPGRLRTKLVAG